MMRAAALTYTTLLSIVPLMVVSVTILSFFPVFQLVNSQIQNFILHHFIATSGQTIQAYLEHAASHTHHLSRIGFISLFITALLMIFNIEYAFNEIWHVEKSRRGIIAFFLYWAILLITPILIGITFVIGYYLTSVPLIALAINPLLTNPFSVLVTSFLLSTIIFFLFYKILPNCYVPTKYALSSALIAAILFEIAKFSFTFYIAHFTAYTLIYGALATIPIFLIWLYISWVIILLGAVMCRVLTIR
jgi:membrane protein